MNMTCKTLHNKISEAAFFKGKPFKCKLKDATISKVQTSPMPFYATLLEPKAGLINAGKRPIEVSLISIRTYRFVAVHGWYSA